MTESTGENDLTLENNELDINDSLTKKINLADVNNNNETIIDNDKNKDEKKHPNFTPLTKFKTKRRFMHNQKEASLIERILKAVKNVKSLSIKNIVIILFSVLIILILIYYNILFLKNIILSVFNFCYNWLFTIIIMSIFGCIIIFLINYIRKKGYFTTKNLFSINFLGIICAIVIFIGLCYAAKFYFFQNII